MCFRCIQQASPYILQASACTRTHPHTSNDMPPLCFRKAIFATHINKQPLKLQGVSQSKRFHYAREPEIGTSTDPTRRSKLPADPIGNMVQYRTVRYKTIRYGMVRYVTLCTVRTVCPIGTIQYVRCVLYRMHSTCSMCSIYRLQHSMYSMYCMCLSIQYQIH